MQTTGR